MPSNGAGKQGPPSPAEAPIPACDQAGANFFIQHERHGVFVEDVLKPRFTWKYADKSGKRFDSAADAQAFIDSHQPTLKGCTVKAGPRK